MAEGENNVIIAALYMTEIVNAALTTITDNDDQEREKEKLFDLRNAQLNKQISDVTMLFSTMNVYANNLGIDTNQLGKNIYILYFFYKLVMRTHTNICLFRLIYMWQMLN